MEEVIWRFPHIGDQIFVELGDSSLARCRETNRLWQDFITNEKFYKKRIQEMIDEEKESYEELFVVTPSLTPLHTAAMTGQTGLLIDILESESNKNPPEEGYGYTPLHFAASKGFISTCQLIIENIEDIFPLNEDGETPFLLASREGHTGVCRLFIEKVFEKYSDDKKRRETLLQLPDTYCKETPLGNAAIYGHFSVYSLILAHVEDKNPKNKYGSTALHMAAMLGHLDMCELIMDNIIDKNPCNKSGETPFHFAAIGGQLEVCKLFTRKIIEKNPRDQNGQTPLHFAANGGNVSVCEYIIDNNEDKNPADEKGFTPLHLAAKFGHVNVCELLLGNITDKHPKNKDGFAPLHLAVIEGHLNVCQLIVDEVEDKHPITTPGGFTPFDYAVAGWNQSIIDLLQPDHRIGGTLATRRAIGSPTFWP